MVAREKLGDVSAPGVEDLGAAGLPNVGQLVAAAVGVEGLLNVWSVEVRGHLVVYAWIIRPCMPGVNCHHSFLSSKSIVPLSHQVVAVSLIGNRKPAILCLETSVCLADGRGCQVTWLSCTQLHRAFLSPITGISKTLQ